MTAVPRASLRAEIVGGLGIRPQRISLRPATTDLLLPCQPEVLRKPPMLDRTQEAADAFAATRAGRPAGFHSARQYGRTTLLRNTVAAAAERRLAAAISELFGSTAAAAEQAAGKRRNGHPQPS
jgi:hypothetical protein